MCRRYIAAYLLASLSGNEPSADTLKEIIGSVGAEFDADAAAKVIDALKGKSVEEVIAEGQDKLASMPAGGAAPAAGGAAAAAGGDAPAAKEPEPEPEESEEEMGFGLFD